MTVERRLITLLTDFGLRDSYVGAMKGVLARLAPGVEVVDICHDVPPQDVRRGGMIWAEAVSYFPGGCIHVGVVDPGVGSRRRILAFEARGSIFLAPDNGLAPLALSRREIRRVFSVERRSLFLTRVSSTFHGRDIFAPVAARLATGLYLDAVGPPAGSYERVTLPRPRRRRRKVGRRTVVEVSGEVLYLDSFGNAVTNLDPLPGMRLVELQAGRLILERLEATYARVREGEPLALVGSSGRIEVAVHGSSAAAELALRPGMSVVALWR